MIRVLFASLFCMFVFSSYAKSKNVEKTVTLHILETTDVHGSFFPYDFIEKKDKKGSLARVSTVVKRLRAETPDGVVLLDNGDILQGQPINYYYNFEATKEQNIAARCINYLRYDAETWGNHDVEPGHAVFDKWTSEVNCPMLGCNVIDKATGKPYLKPYTIVKRQGVKIAIIGMITPAIPNWLTEDVYEGLEFQNMTEAARQWVPYVQQKEHPDIIVGLFHAGREGGIKTDAYDEDPSLEIAETVPGFDIVFFGHDHQKWCKTVKCSDGSDVVTLNSSNAAMNLTDAVVTLKLKDGKVIAKSIEGKLINVADEEVDADYMKTFAKEIEAVKVWSDRVIGQCAKDVTTRDCFFGSSAFNDLILNLQLKITGADIAFSAPLTFDATIHKGPITVSDMFKLYKFENKLFVMNLTGEEIRRHLEMSYDLWVNTMKSPQDHIMLLNSASKDDNQRSGFKNMTFNFDSAAGIDYEVDVTKPDGQKVHILRMSNGQPFDEKRTYKVALNSYRANGGGELLTKGAGIPKEQLDARIIYRSELDQRHYLMEEIQRQKMLSPEPNNNWRFVPEEWTKPALERDRKLIYNE